MRVDIDNPNPAFIAIMEDCDQKVFLDANFFIPPDRSNLGIKPYRFEHFRDVWLDPLLSEFSRLSIHEAVYDELVEELVKKYVDDQVGSDPARICIHSDSELTEVEIALRNHFMAKIAVHSQYDPNMDNAKDRGEVRSLSFMAARKYLYFAANDSLPIRLIKDADKLDSGLKDMGIIQMYELIYYLYLTGKYDNKSLRILYKYEYYLTAREKNSNPGWEEFISGMNSLYGKKGKG